MAEQWQFDDARPIYTQLVEGIERAVVTGQYAPGQRLPGVRELAAQAGVNPNTMQRSLAALEDKGLLYSQRTSGRFVTEDTGNISALRGQLARGLTEKYLADMAALGLPPAEIRQWVTSQTENAPHEEEE